MKAKKSLGQNFLKSKIVVNTIINISDLNLNDVVLEIGPGKGFLTEELLKKVKKVIVVEKDDRLIYFLKEKFKEDIKLEKLKIIHKDILDFEDKNIKKPYKIIANIPYYITGQIIKKFLSSQNQPNKIILMVQNEVAKRIIQQKESIISISVKTYGKPKYIKKIKAENFSPKPKVDSAILLIDDISKDFFENIDENDFFSVVKAGFSHKRKFLMNNILTDWKNNVKNIKKQEIEEIFKNLNISSKIRAEKLNIEDWKNLYINLKK